MREKFSPALSLPTIFFNSLNSSAAPQTIPHKTNKMTSNPEPPPGPAVCPGSPRPKQASVFTAHDAPGGGAAAASHGNISDDPPCLPMISPPGPFGGRWVEGPPPGFEHLYPPPFLPTGNRIPPAGTLFGTEQRPPPVSSPEISSGPPPPDSSIFGNRSFPNDPFFEARARRPVRISGKRYAISGMEKCNAIASTRVVSLCNPSDSDWARK